MCIVTSWPATKVAKLTLIIELLGLLLGVRQLQDNEPLMQAISIPMVAYGVGAAGCTVLAFIATVPKDPLRLRCLLFLAIATFLHARTSFGAIPKYQAALEKQAVAVCTKWGSPEEPLAAAASELHAMFMNPIAERNLRADTVVPNVKLYVDSSLEQMAMIRNVKKLEPATSEMLSAMRQMSCQAALVNLVQGDMKVPVKGIGILSLMGGLLCVYIVMRLWCEDFESGTRFRRRLFPEEYAEEMAAERAAAAATAKRKE